MKEFIEGFKEDIKIRIATIFLFVTLISLATICVVIY
jgi:hypothetical protein